jgi:predicted methyltransferase
MRLALTLLFATLTCGAYAATLDEVLAGPQRDPANVARDAYRHPKAVLEFFGVQPTSTVVEVWPSGGWWVEILGPYLREQGVYYAAGVATTLKDLPESQLNSQRALADKLAGNALFDHVVLTGLGYPGRLVMAPPGRVDVVMTFRNVHNWLAGGYADEMFQAFSRTLKPGGVLGVVEHRAKPGASIDVMKKTGYMTEEYVIGLAKQAGLTLEGKSEINANPKDTTDHPAGVWSLPPNLRVCQPMPEGAQKDACVAEYRAIGESDRMTLKFRKPAPSAP